MKRIIKYILLIILVLLLIVVIQNYPISSKAKDLPRLADTSNIKRNLEAIINTPNYRNYKNVSVLDTVYKIRSTNAQQKVLCN
jgi:hypothetical protein